MGVPPVVGLRPANRCTAVVVCEPRGSNRAPDSVTAAMNLFVLFLWIVLAPLALGGIGSLLIS